MTAMTTHLIAYDELASGYLEGKDALNCTNFKPQEAFILMEKLLEESPTSLKAFGFMGALTEHDTQIAKASNWESDRALFAIPCFDAFLKTAPLHENQTVAIKWMMTFMSFVDHEMRGYKAPSTQCKKLLAKSFAMAPFHTPEFKDLYMGSMIENLMFLESRPAAPETAFMFPSPKSFDEAAFLACVEAEMLRKSTPTPTVSASPSSKTGFSL